jgi:hypothetical protein
VSAFTCYGSDREVRTVVYRDGQAMTCGEIVDTFRDKDAELRARREILDAVAEAAGEGNCWLKAATIDWRQRLRDFAGDSERHQISFQQWKGLHDTFPGIMLYAVDGFYVAYYEDAAELWNQADDTLPMFHVMVQSDPPHRTVIHPLHLNAWVEHLARICLPVTFTTPCDG